MESVLVKVVSFIAVIVVGYLLKRVGFFRSEDFRLIAGLVLKVTLPCAIISNFTRIDVDAALFVLVLLGLGCNLVTVVAGWLDLFHRSGGGREKRRRRRPTFLQADVCFCSDGCLCRHDDSGFPRLEASAAGAGVYRHGGRSESVPCDADDRHRL